MEKFKGTKGKWIVERPDEKYRFVYVNTESIKYGALATCYAGSLESDEEALANAQLISCAPEMLEMLVRISDFMPESKEIKDLIKKATCTDK